jgi:hypothetical protein
MRPGVDRDRVGAWTWSSSKWETKLRDPASSTDYDHRLRRHSSHEVISANALAILGEQVGLLTVGERGAGNVEFIDPQFAVDLGSEPGEGLGLD